MDCKLRKLRRYKWVVWGMLCIAFLIVYFFRLSIGVVREHLISDFNISSTAFANLSSAYFYAYTFMQIPTGIMADTFGPRKIVTVGLALSALGSLVFGLAPNQGMVFAGRLIMGFGTSVVFVSILKIQTEWFYEKEFSTLSGAASFIGNMGGILAQTPLVMLVSLLTWRYAFVFMGAVSLIFSLLVFMLVRNKPTDLGLPSVNEISGRNVKSEKINLLNAFIDICKNPYTWPPFIVYVGFMGVYVLFSGVWGVAYLNNVYGMSSAQSANYIILVILGLSIGSVIVGNFSDRLYKRKLPMLISGGIGLLAWIILLLSKSGLPHIILGIILFMIGFACATYIPTWACGKEVNNPRYSGMSVSIINTGGFMGAALVPIIPGVIIDKYGQIMAAQQLYKTAFMFCFICVIISYIAIFFVKETGCRNIYTSTLRKDA